MTARRPLVLACVLVAAAWGLSACAGEPAETNESVSETNETSAPNATESEAPEDSSDSAAEAVVQAADCGWEMPRIAGSGSAPSDPPSELATRIIGAWQHTYFSEGGAQTATLPDIRYIFPSEGGLIYCQDIPGSTSSSEARTDFVIEGTFIKLPDDHPGFEVIAISDDAMLWINHIDGSEYLLERR